jgi:hypothetical protein
LRFEATVETGDRIPGVAEVKVEIVDARGGFILHPWHCLGTIEPGKQVQVYEPLSEGETRLQALRAACTRNTSRKVQFRGDVLKQILELYDDGKLTSLRFDVTRRTHTLTGGFGYSEESCLSTDTGAFKKLRRELEQLSEGTLLEIRDDIHSRVPLEVSAVARPDPDRVCHTHPLESEEDWEWFQGSKLPGDSADPSEGKKCFAETAEAAYLIQKANIYLFGHLFKLVNLVDTPGLDSTSDAHTELTEAFIEEGDAYVVMFNVMDADSSEATPRLLASISSYLAVLEPDRQKQLRRVFLVLNWFRRRVPDSSKARRHVEEFEKLVECHFGVPATAYVIDLDAVMRKTDIAEELLGRPSLVPLFDDLRAYVAETGLGDKLQRMRQDLEQCWKDQLEALGREEKVLTGKANPQTELRAVREAMGRFGPGGMVREELKKIADQKYARVTEPILRLREELGKIKSRDGFRDLQTACDEDLANYDRARRSLPELVKDAKVIIRKHARNMLNPPTLKDVKRPLPPKLDPELFKDAVTSIDLNWPDVAERSWQRVRGFVSSFDRRNYAEKQRDALLEAQLSQGFIGQVTATTNAFRDAFMQEATQACDAARADLEATEAQLQTREGERADEVKKLATKRESIQSFAPTYRSLMTLIHKEEACLRSIEIRKAGAGG